MIGAGGDLTVFWSNGLGGTITTLAFTLLFFTLHFAAMRNEILRRRVRSMRLIQAQEMHA